MPNLGDGLVEVEIPVGEENYKVKADGLLPHCMQCNKWLITGKIIRCPVSKEFRCEDCGGA